MNINRIVLSSLCVVGFLFSNLAAMPEPMDIDQPTGQAGIEQLGDLPTAMIVEDLALYWILTHPNLHDVAVQVYRTYGREIGAAVARKIREIVEQSIIIENNSRHVATATLNLQIAGTQPIQVTLNPGERRIVELAENLRVGLRTGINVRVNASFQVPPTDAPIKSLQTLRTVTGGGRIIINMDSIGIRNIIEPTLPPLRRQRGKRNLLGPE